MDNIFDQVYGSIELADLMEVTPTTIRMRWLTGAIPRPFMIKGRYYWTRKEIDDLLEAHPELIGSRQNLPRRHTTLKNVS